MSIINKTKMNELIWGIFLLILGLIISTIGGFKANDGWNKLKNKDKTDDSNYNVKSENQKGGVTAGKIENLSINIGTDTNNEQLKKDIQTALIYQTEINHFYIKFKTCLHWSLPLGENIDKNLDSVFNYGSGFANGIDFNRISKELVSNIFIQNDFRKIMPNYSGEGNFRPTGFNNLLGILDYFNEQIEKHLNKYGSSTSSELTTRIEYMQHMITSTIRNIRLDLRSYDKTTKQTADNIADLLVLMRDDFNIMKSQYTKDIKGGYPVSIGTVTKSDSKNGEIVIESQFSIY